MKAVSFNGDELSKLSFGTVQLGLNYGVSNIGGKPSQDEANSIVNYLVKEGVTCFDTAIAYGDSEKVLGEALGNQNKVKVISKISSSDFVSNAEYFLYQSLKALRTEQLFGLLLHDTRLLANWTVQKDEDVSRLQQAGLIKYFGVSIYSEKEFDLAIENSSINLIQIPFNIFDQRAVKSEWFERAKNANKMIFIRSIFLQGLFFMESAELTGNLEKAEGYLKEFRVIQKKTGLTIVEFAMSYVDTVAPDAVMLFGCDSLNQAKENIQLYHNLPTLEEKVLDDIQICFSHVPDDIINPSLWGKK